MPRNAYVCKWIEAIDSSARYFIKVESLFCFNSKKRNNRVLSYRAVLIRLNTNRNAMLSKSGHHPWHEIDTEKASFSAKPLSFFTWNQTLINPMESLVSHRWLHWVNEEVEEEEEQKNSSNDLNDDASPLFACDCLLTCAAMQYRWDKLEL